MVQYPTIGRALSRSRSPRGSSTAKGFTAGKPAGIELMISPTVGEAFQPRYEGFSIASAMAATESRIESRSHRDENSLLSGVMARVSATAASGCGAGREYADTADPGEEVER